MSLLDIGFLSLGHIVRFRDNTSGVVIEIDGYKSIFIPDSLRDNKSSFISCSKKNYPKFMNHCSDDRKDITAVYYPCDAAVAECLMLRDWDAYSPVWREETDNRKKFLLEFVSDALRERSERLVRAIENEDFETESKMQWEIEYLQDLLCDIDENDAAENVISL